MQQNPKCQKKGGTWMDFPSSLGFYDRDDTFQRSVSSINSICDVCNCEKHRKHYFKSEVQFISLNYYGTLKVK